MSRRNPGNNRANRIRGPQSALTDFLASHNISANQIRQDYERRVREAEDANGRPDPQQAEDEPSENNDAAQGTASALDDEDLQIETAAERKKRKRREQAALQKIKQSKNFKKRKTDRDQGGEPDGDDDEIAWDMMYEKTRPLPGQQENCEICDKRFTVTAYCKNGPTGGLLCPACSKEMEKDLKAERKEKAKGGPRAKRRQAQSNLLDGIIQYGASSLLEICVKKVADNIHDVEEFGDLPPDLLHRLAQILSKRRALDSRTVQLFLKPELDAVEIYDCGKLETNDFHKIFAFMHDLKKVDLRCAGQIKDEVIEYMLQHNHKITHLRMDSPNLVSDDVWQRVVTKLGPQLESFKITYLDVSFGDDTVKKLASSCPKLQRLKLADLHKPGDDALLALANLPSLKHLSLDFLSETHADPLNEMITTVGPRLETLSLRRFHDADDGTLAAIHSSCSQLDKFRIHDNTLMTDKSIAALFTNWSNKALRFIDFSSVRDVESDNDLSDEDEQESRGPTGLGPEGFKAMMRHSGQALEHLNISSCRAITHAAFSEVFEPTNRYPKLKSIDISLITTVDDVLVTSMFRCCPALQKLSAFACFNVRDVKVPKNAVLIGGLSSHDALELEGSFVGQL